jgi:S1-C subfamily serine protease
MPMQTLLSLSNDLAAAVERAARSVVAVHARPRLPSTGVHWRPGIVVTAEHTVRVDEEIRVAWPDGRTAPARLVARDPGTDLAVLRIGDTDWPVAEVGDSAVLNVGNLVLAVGYGPRASWGVVSAVGGAWRTWRGGEVDRFLRVDLVLYPGFSGGPLVDASAKVAGLVTSGLSRPHELAVPTSTVTRIVDELLATGRISRGYLGLGLQPVALPEALRRLAPGSDARGLIVVSLENDGPAARAGMMLGDVLLALEGTAIHDPGDIQTVLAGRRAGTAVTTSLIRAGAPLEVAITLGERPSQKR